MGEGESVNAPWRMGVSRDRAAVIDAEVLYKYARGREIGRPDLRCGGDVVCGLLGMAQWGKIMGVGNENRVDAFSLPKLQLPATFNGPGVLYNSGKPSHLIGLSSRLLFARWWFVLNYLLVYRTRT